MNRKQLENLIKEELTSLISEHTGDDWFAAQGAWEEHSEFPGVEHRKTGSTVFFKHPDPQKGKPTLEAVLDHLTQGLMDDHPTREISEPWWDDRENAWVAASTTWGSA